MAHLRNNAQPSNYGSNDADALGIPGVNINEFSSGQVGIFLTGFGQTNQDYPLIGYSASVPWIRGESNIDFVNNWTKIIRNHTVKFGGDLREFVTTYCRTRRSVLVVSSGLPISRHRILRAVERIWVTMSRAFFSIARARLAATLTRSSRRIVNGGSLRL